MYAAFVRAYKFFNQSLFGGELPACLITMDRSVRKAFAYFSGGRWKSSEKRGRDIDELSFNPVYLSRDMTELLATFVHEMTHGWQYNFGRPSPNGYHNKEWAAKMVSIGLQPSDTGRIGGSQTGQNVGHYVLSGGKFELCCGKVIAAGFKLPFYDKTVFEEKKERRDFSKVKFSCPGCQLNAWGKLGINVVCGDCGFTLKCEISNM